MSVWASRFTLWEDNAPYEYEGYGHLGERKGIFDLAIIPGVRQCARVSLNEEFALLDEQQLLQLRDVLNDLFPA